MTDIDGHEKELSALLAQLGIQPNTLTPAQRAGALAALSNEGIDIFPTPSFVIKSYCLSVNTPSSNTNNRTPTSPESAIPKSFSVPNGKVFINICFHDAIPPVKTAPKPTSNNSYSSSNDDQPAVSIPIAVGPVKSDTDKDGRTVIVVDMVVHPSVTIDCERDGSGAFRHWLCQLAIQYLYKKHNILINNQYRLPLLKYKGNTVTSQRVRKPNPSATGIQEVRPTVPSSSSPNNSEKMTPSSSQNIGNSSNGTSSGLETVTPLSLIAEAGGLPSISTALGPVQKGGATQVAPRRTPVIPQENIQMDIRIVGKDTDSTDKDIHTRIKEDMHNQTNDQFTTSSSSLHIAKDSNGRPISSPVSTGLQQVKTTRINKPLTPIITINTVVSTLSHQTLEITDNDSNELDNDGSTRSSTTYACTLVPTESSSPSSSSSTTTPTKASSFSTPASSTTNTNDILYYRVELSSAIPFNDTPTASNTLSFSFTFPEPNNSDQLAVRLNNKNLKIIFNGTGDTVTLTAEGYRKCVLNLPVRCTMVTQDTGTTKDNQSHQGPRVISAIYDTDFRMLTFRLPVYFDQKLRLPQLPITYQDTPSVRDILRQYIEADANHFEPDPGSKPWLLAQALAASATTNEDIVETKSSSSSTPSSSTKSQTLYSSSSTRPLDDDTPVQDDEELPEDVFLRSDALSLHFLRQREEDAKRQGEKEQERQVRRGNQPYKEINTDNMVTEEEEKLTLPPTISNVNDNPGTLTNIGSTTSSNTIIKSYPVVSSGEKKISPSSSENAPVDPALLYDIL